MKIQQKCDEKAVTPLTHIQVPTGTVYRYGSHDAGPYLRVLDGLVDLKTNTFYGGGYLGAAISNYLVLPNARVVLE